MLHTGKILENVCNIFQWWKKRWAYIKKRMLNSNLKACGLTFLQPLVVQPLVMTIWNEQHSDLHIYKFWTNWYQIYINRKRLESFLKKICQHTFLYNLEFKRYSLVLILSHRWLTPCFTYVIIAYGMADYFGCGMASASIRWWEILQLWIWANDLTV